MYLYASFYVSGMNKHIEDFLVLFVLSNQGKKKFTSENDSTHLRPSVETQITGLQAL